MEDSKIIYTKTYEVTKSNSITIQLSNFKGKDLLNIYKSSFSDRYTGIVKNNSIAFSLDQVDDLKNIIFNIPEDYDIKEYGDIGKYKIYISTFNGSNSFQIREWVESEKYTGYGKKGVSITMEKFDLFKLSLDEVIVKSHEYLNGDIEEKKQNHNDDDIESYF